MLKYNRCGFERLWPPLPHPTPTPTPGNVCLAFHLPTRLAYKRIIVSLLLCKLGKEKNALFHRQRCSHQPGFRGRHGRETLKFGFLISPGPVGITMRYSLRIYGDIDSPLSGLLTQLAPEHSVRLKPPWLHAMMLKPLGPSEVTEKVVWPPRCEPYLAFKGKRFTHGGGQVPSTIPGWVQGLLHHHVQPGRF